MPLTTPQDLIGFSARAMGLLGTGQTALPEDYRDAFSALNGMIGQWNRRRYLIWHLLDVHVVMNGSMSYSLGPGGDFNYPRTDRLEAAYFRQFVNATPNYVDYPLQILESREDYSRIALKGLTSFPNVIFYDSAYPLGYVYPYPIPLNNGTYELHILIKETIPQFTSYVQSLNLPEEYVEAIWTNLTIRMATMYPGSVISDDLRGLAKASLLTIRGSNAQIPRLLMPRRLTRPGLYNIYSGQVY